MVEAPANVHMGWSIQCTVVTKGSTATCTCCLSVDAFATGLKINQVIGVLLGVDQSVKTLSDRYQLITTFSQVLRRRGYIFVLWTPVKSSDQELWKGMIKQSRTIFTYYVSWSRSQTLLWAVCKGLHLSRSCDHTCGLSTRLPTQRGRGSLVQLHSESHYGIVLA